MSVVDWDHWINCGKHPLDCDRCEAIRIELLGVQEANAAINNSRVAPRRPVIRDRRVGATLRGRS